MNSRLAIRIAVVGDETVQQIEAANDYPLTKSYLERSIAMLLLERYPPRVVEHEGKTWLEFILPE